jgi:hypothetical protein
MQNILVEYGKTLLPKVIDKRKLLYFENPEEVIENIDILKIPYSKYEIVKRFHTNNEYNLNWHIDNRQLQKHKIENKTDNLEIIYLSDKYKYGLWTHKEYPKYTAIIYLTSDFEGGEFCFVDKIIKPKRGDIIIFDSREVHKVNKLKSGIRNCYVIKFF